MYRLRILKRHITKCNVWTLDPDLNKPNVKDISEITRITINWLLNNTMELLFSSLFLILLGVIWHCSYV